jgi:2EXR family
MTTSQVFELFPKLPCELRAAIWKTSLPSIRLIRLASKEDKGDDWDEDLELEWWEVEYLEDLHGTFFVESLREKIDDEWPCDIPGMGDLELQHLKDRLGSDAYEEDTRSLPEKDLRLYCHKCARGLDERLKQQTQLNKYGFTSSRAAPTLGHVLEYDMTYYQGFGETMLKHISPRRDLQLLSHGNSFSRMNQTPIQAQLRRYGFITSRPTPTLRYGNIMLAEWDSQRKFWYTNEEFPTILHVCSESRAVALREGYALSFASPQFPARTWFNPYTDYLQIWPRDEWSSSNAIEMLCKDLKRVRKLVIDIYDYQRGFSEVVRKFENLEELVIMLKDEVKTDLEPNTSPLCEKLRIVDATEAEILNGYSGWTDLFDDPFPRFRDVYIEVLGPHILAYNKSHPNGPPFLEKRSREIQQQLIGYRNDSPYPGDRGRKAPLVRFAFLTIAEGERMLYKIREHYWAEREQLPPPNVAAEIFAEERDRIRTQRLPSPFDARWADDIEAEHEYFLEIAYNRAGE